MKQSSYWLLATLSFSILTGCAGSGKSVPGSGNATVPLSLVRTSVSINIAASAGAQSVRPKYVSPSTLGVAITIYGALATPPPGPTTVANLSAGSSLCTSNPDGSRTCTVSVLAPIGNDNFIVTTYDQPPSGTIPQGNILSTTTLQYVVVAGQTNTVPLTLNGVPATIVLSPPGFLVPPNQTNTFTFTVNAKDAGGNYIIGPGNYTQPIALVISNDPNHAISLSTTSITSPATTSVTGTYNGGSLPGIATITGSATGATSGATTVQSSSAVTQVTVIVPPAPTTASQTQQVLPQSGFWSIPGFGGFTGSFSYSTNNAPSGTTASITTSTTAPATLPNPQPSGVPILYVSLALTQTTTFTQGVQSMAVTLPSSVTTAGQTFYQTVYDLTAGTNITQGPNTTVVGTGSQTITFGSGPSQNPNSVTFPANENYLVVISQNPPSGTISEYAVPSAPNYAIATGPDGALWFTEYSRNKIGRITTTGAFTEYSIPTASSGPFGIVAGPDGALWFAESLGNKVGRITTAGVVTNEYPVPATGGSGPGSLALGPDGALWFTEYFAVGRITTGGSVILTAPPTGGSYVSGIAAGPDGALWFTENAGNKIGRITTSGVVTNEYPVPASNGAPVGIVAGPDGALWFCVSGSYSTNQIGRITTGGSITLFPIPTSNGQPTGIVVGSDGALWFSEANGNKIGRITTGGSAIEYAIPTIGAGPYGIAAGPDGNVWFTETGASKIGKIVP